jgi:hypothetical protein
MNYPLGVEKFIEFLATENDLTMEEVVEEVVIDWFATNMAKMSLFGVKPNKICPFVWNKETGERFTGEVLFMILYRRYQDEILTDGANWRRHLEYVERSKANNERMRDIIRELKMATDAGTLASHKPESGQERAIKDPESYAIAKKILEEVFEENAAL